MLRSIRAMQGRHKDYGNGVRGGAPSDSPSRKLWVDGRLTLKETTKVSMSRRSRGKPDERSATSVAAYFAQFYGNIFTQSIVLANASHVCVNRSFVRHTSQNLQFRLSGFVESAFRAWSVSRGYFSGWRPQLQEAGVVQRLEIEPNRARVRRRFYPCATALGPQ